MTEKIPTELMDAVDRQQQREIEVNRLWTKIIAILFTLTTISVVALYSVLMEFLRYVKTHP